MDRKGDLAALAAVLLLIVFLFADVLFGSHALYIRDLARTRVPEAAILRGLLASGGLPHWNPHFAGGQPLAANPVFDLFYPLQWLVLLPDLVRAIHIQFVVHIALGAAGVFLLLRALGVRRAAAAFGSAAFAMSGVVASLTNLPMVLFSIAWWPWIAFFTTRYLTSRRVADFAAAVLATGMLLLIGEQSMILQGGALLAAYCAAKARWRGVAIAAAICAASVLVGAAQILPALDVQRDTDRALSLPYESVAKWSLAPARPLELALPELFARFTPDASFVWSSDDPSGGPWLFSFYLGMLTATLVVAGFVHRLPGWPWFAAIAAAAYVLAIGRHGPLLPLLYRAGFGFARYPEKFFLSAAFVLMIFGAIALDRFLIDARFRRTTFFTAIAIACAAAASIAFANWRGLPPEARIGAINSTEFAIVLVLILTFRERQQLCLALLALFVIADLGSRSRGWAPRFDRALYDAPPIARALPPGARIYNDDDLQISFGRMSQAALTPKQNWWRARNAMRPEMQALRGFDSILELDVTRLNLRPTAEFAALFRSARLNGRPDLVPMLLSFAGVNAVIETRSPTDVANPVRVVALPDNTRWYFADQLVTTSRITEPPRWSRHVAFIDRPFAPAPGRVVRARESLDALDFDADSAGTAALVISITPHRYWSATIDGVPAPLYRANIGFQAITVPRGSHHIAMRYHNPAIMSSVLVTLLSVAILAVLIVRGTRA